MKRVVDFIKSRNVYLLIGLLLLFGFISTWIMINRAELILRADYLEKARIISVGFSRDQIKNLSGTNADQNLPDYQDIKRQMVSIRNEYPDIRFVYLLGKKADGSVFFFGDSEAITSADYSPPGQIYAEAAQGLKDSFNTQEAIVLNPVNDRWGTWVTAVVPLVDHVSGETIALLRIDTPLDGWYWTLAGRVALPFFLLVGLIVVVILAFVINRYSHNTSHPILKDLMAPVGFILMTAVFITQLIIYQQQLSMVNDRVNQLYADVGYDFNSGLAQQTNSMMLMSETLSLNPVVQQAIINHDIVRLREDWQSVFEKMHTTYQLLEFDFLDAQRSCLLSIDQAEPCNGIENHFSTLEAQRTGLPFSGLEVENTGIITIRSVYPVIVNGKVVGFLEAARGVDDVITDVMAQSNTHLALMMNKKFLDRQAWEANMTTLGRTAEWDRFSDGVITFSSQGRLPEFFTVWAESVIKDAIKLSTGQEMSTVYESGSNWISGNIWRVDTLPLMDTSGQDIGNLLVMIDISDVNAVFRQRMALAGGMSATALIIMLVIMYVLLNRADAFVLKQQENLKLARQAAGFGILNYDLELQKFLIDARAREIWGLSADEDFNDGMFKRLVMAEDFPAVRAAYARAIDPAGDGAFILECRLLSANGEAPRWVSATGQTTFKDGKPLTLNGITQDISAHKAVEAELHESQERYQEMFENSMDAVLMTRPDGSIQSANKAAERMFGRSKAEIIQVGRSGIMDVNDPRLVMALQRREQTGSFSGELTGIRKDGSRFPMELSSSMFKDNQGFLRTGISMRDISQRRELEDRLRESTDLLNALMLYSPVHIFIKEVTAQTNRVVLASENYVDMVGIPGSKMVGKLNEELFPAELAATLAEDDRQAVSEGRVLQVYEDFNGHSYKTIKFPIQQAGKQLLAGFSVDITDLKQAEHSLKTSEERYRAVTQSAQDAIVTVDSDGNIAGWNNGAQTIFGFTEDEALGKPMTLLVPEEIQGPHVMGWQPGLVTVALGFNGMVVENIGRRKDGSQVYLELSLSAWQVGDEKFYTAIGRDISDRKQADALIKESEERYRLLFENSLDAVLLVNEKGIYSTNPAVEKLFGYSEEEICQLNQFGLFDIEDETMQRLVKGRQERQNFNGEFICIRKDGTKFPVEVSTNFFTGRDGRLNGGIFIRDITQRIQAEAAQRASEARFKQLAEIFPETIFEADLNSRLTYLNEHGYDAFGVTETDLQQGVLLSSLTLPEHLEQVEKRINERLAGLQGGFLEYTALRKDGTPFEVLRYSDVVYADGIATGVRGFFMDITERKQIERARAESETNFHTFFDTIEDIIVISTPAGKIISANPMLMSKLGYAGEELIGRSVMEFYPEEFRQQFIVECQAVLAGEKSGFIMPIQTKSGAFIPLDTRVWQGQWNGKPCIFGFAQDISKEQEARERFERIFQGNPALMALSSINDQKFVDVNHAWLDTLGYTADEVIGKDSKDLNIFVYPEQQAAVAAELAATGKINRVELQVKRKDGQVLDGLFYGELIGLQGNLFFLTVMIDITDRKTIEAKLLESESNYRNLFDDSPISLWEEDYSEVARVLTRLRLEGVKDFNEYFQQHPDVVAECVRLVKILNVNKATLVLYDAPSKKDLLTNLSVVFPEISHPDFIKQLVQISYGVSRFEMVTVNQTMNGKPITVSLNWATMPGLEVELSRVIVSLVDITERNRAQKALQAANQQLEESIIMANDYAMQADKANIAKSDFLANMSHEIRTPMNGVIGMTSLLLDTNLDAEQRRYAETVNSSGKMLLTLINDILDFSKMEAGKLELENKAFDLQLMLDELVASMGIKARETAINLHYDLDPTIPVYLVGDSTRLRQILTNLMGNALKFTHHGEVVVKIKRQQPKTGGSLGLNGVVNPQTGEAANSHRQVSLRFSVRDTGIGIPPEKVGLLFSKFMQVDSSVTRQYGGTGLGLAIAKQLVELMGGRIGVESMPGHGSEFWFTIDFNLNETGRDELASLEILKNVRVLVVDDNPTGRDVLRARLAYWGMRTVEVDGASAALQALLSAVEENDPFRIALLDMQMPMMVGSTLGQNIKNDERLANTKMILLTSISDGRNPERFEKIGFSAVLSKPVIHTELSQALVKALEGTEQAESPVNKTVTSKNGLVKDLKYAEKSWILLAEDNLTNQQVAVGVLKKLGLPNVDVVFNGREALNILAKKHYDMVLMDVQMPEMDGLEATRLIRDFNSQVLDHAIPIIAMTARALAGDRESCQKAGMNDYLAKPFEVRTLLDVLSRWLPFEAQDAQKNAGTGGHTETGEKAEAGRNAIKKSAAPVIFDKEGLLDRLMYDDELIRVVLEGFIGNIPEQILALKNYLSSNDMLSAERQAHTIKGASANVGGEALRAVAFEMEKTARRGDLSALESLLPELERQYQLLREVLKGEV